MHISHYLSAFTKISWVYWKRLVIEIIERVLKSSLRNNQLGIIHSVDKKLRNKLRKTLRTTYRQRHCYTLINKPQIVRHFAQLVRFVHAKYNSWKIQSDTVSNWNCCGQTPTRTKVVPHRVDRWSHQLRSIVFRYVKPPSEFAVRLRLVCGSRLRNAPPNGAGHVRNSQLNRRLLMTKLPTPSCISSVLRKQDGCDTGSSRITFWTLHKKARGLKHARPLNIPEALTDRVLRQFGSIIRWDYVSGCIGKQLINNTSENCLIGYYVRKNCWFVAIRYVINEIICFGDSMKYTFYIMIIMDFWVCCKYP